MTTHDSLLWHYRFCHLNLERLIQLFEKELILRVPKLTMPEKSSEVCLIGKKPRNSFSWHVAYRSLDVLHMIHSDVCGPLEVSFIGRN